MTTNALDNLRRVQEEAVQNKYAYAFNIKNLKVIQKLCTLTNERVNLRLNIHRDDYYPHIGIQVLCTDLNTLEVNYYVTDPTSRLDKPESIYDKQVKLQVTWPMVPSRYLFMEIGHRVKDVFVHTPRDTPQTGVLALLWFTEWATLVEAHINTYPKTQAECESTDE